MRLSKTAKPIGAVRETAMGSRSPAGPRRRWTASTRPWRAAAGHRLGVCPPRVPPLKFEGIFTDFVLSDVLHRSVPRAVRPVCRCVRG